MLRPGSSENVLPFNVTGNDDDIDVREGGTEVREGGMEVREGGTEVWRSGTEVRRGTGSSAVQKSQGIHSSRVSLYQSPEIPVYSH